MMLEIVRQYTEEPVGMLSPLEEAALRAVRAGVPDAAARGINRRTLGRLRDDDRWLLCDCREGAVIVLRRQSSGTITAVNRPDAPVPHAPGCEFALRDAGEDADAAALVADLFLAGERTEPGEIPDDGVERPWTGGRATSLSQVLKTLMQAAGLNRFDGNGPAAPADWAADYRRAAGELRVARRVRLSDILYTDPAEWEAEGTPERLDEMAERWRGHGRPFVLLSWLARDVAARAIDAGHPEAGRVEVCSRVARPVVGRQRIDGPFLFLGMVARGLDGGGWACRAACVHPVLSAEIPMPVDSGYERRALGALRGAVEYLARDPDLHDALGGAPRVELEKPLFPFVVRGGPCLPDALVKVTRPGGRGDVPAGADGPLREGPFVDRDRARYAIEVMGFASAAYERRKENTHARMKRIGRVVRMEATQFDGSWNGLHSQTDRIARRIGKDIVARWGPG